MLTKIEKSTLRGDLFRHLDGIAVAPTAYSLLEKGVLAYLPPRKKQVRKIWDYRITRYKQS